jgi:amidase
MSGRMPDKQSYRLPELPKLKQLGEQLGFHVTDTYAEQVSDVMSGIAHAYLELDQLPDYLPLPKYPREHGIRPDPTDNPCNAWYVKSVIKGAADGPLKGKTVALKDSICVAGIPMMNGAAPLEGYIPEADATIVTRLLDAGATILGKSVTECLGFSGASCTSATGPVDNPNCPGYSVGGSSSGSAALVALGAVDFGIGGDQGGSIRVPASFAGICGLKPTFGLVPYTGIMGIDATIDHAGPLTGTVTDNALVLTVLAGNDGIDSRQKSDIPVPDYCSVLGSSIVGLRIAVIEEGFGQVGSEPDVNATVESAAERLASLGAIVERRSLSWHRFAPAIWAPLVLESGAQVLFYGNGFGSNYQGLYIASLTQALGEMFEKTDSLADTVKVSLLAGLYATQQYRGRYYAKAQNLRRKLRFEYDKILKEFDILLMPTTPMKATKPPPITAPLRSLIEHCWGMNANTCGFNLTGHPSISIPCGTGEGRPIGLMLTAQHFDETTLFRVAYAFEQTHNRDT